MKRYLFLLAALVSSLALADEGRVEAAVSTSNTSARTAALGPGPKMVLCTESTHYRTGSSSVAATVSDFSIPADTPVFLYLTKTEPYIAFILDSGTGSCSVGPRQPMPNGDLPPFASATGGSEVVAGIVETNGLGEATVAVAANSLCICSGRDEVAETCAVSGSTLTIHTASAAVLVTYFCIVVA